MVDVDGAQEVDLGNEFGEGGFHRFHHSATVFLGIA